jgi:succinate dehydrogenase / fumarate reductase iron-sulfur subunit
MRVKFTIQKFNPEQDVRPTDKDYFVETGRRSTVLDALIRLKAEQDGTLTMRYSCRASICGSCGMEINGAEKLACKTQIRDELERHGRIKIAPFKNMPVIKDLVVDMNPFWQSVREITPWLEAPSDKENIPIPKETMATFHNADNCIMCGACVAACTSREVSPGFLGPAALAKAYRFENDPRDRAKEPRLEALMAPNGIWDCCRCNYCVEVCPKDVQPMEQIIRLRRAAIQTGLKDEIGARHITSFVKIVKHEGKLNEGMMPLMMTWTKPNYLLRIIPQGIRMFFKRKVPFPFGKSISGIKQLRGLFQQRGQ